MKKTQHPSALRSKKEISEALLKLMQLYPYSEISVKQIILETNLVRKTFYLNFNNKDDVLYSIIDGLILEYTEENSSSDNDPISIIFNFCSRNKEFLSLLHKNKMFHYFLLRMNEILPNYIDQIHDSNNPFKKVIVDLDPDYLIAFNIGAIWNVIFKWIDRGMVDSLDTIKTSVSQYIKRL